jgi:hypothetical protein
VLVTSTTDQGYYAKMQIEIAPSTNRLAQCVKTCIGGRLGSNNHFVCEYFMHTIDGGQLIKRLFLLFFKHNKQLNNQ